MCRHLAVVGPAVGAAAVLLDAPHALSTQVDSPRHQAAGVVNRDGWGVAWQEDGRWWQHRSVIPLSEDAGAPTLLGPVVSSAVVAAIRRASPGLALVETGNAPFVVGPWAFSLNGFVGGFAAGDSRAPLVAALSPARRQALTGDTDTEVLLGLVLDGLAAGGEPPAVLQRVVRRALDAAGRRDSRLNVLLTDGATIWATRWSNSLFHRRPGDGGAVVASEPWDDDPGWAEVPERSLVTASAGDVHLAPLA